MVIHFAVGDTVRIARRLCCAEPGAVWEVIGYDHDRVVIRSPGGFVLDVPTDQLARASAVVVAEPSWASAVYCLAVTPPELIPAESAATI